MSEVARSRRTSAYVYFSFARSGANVLATVLCASALGACASSDGEAANKNVTPGSGGVTSSGGATASGGAIASGGQGGSAQAGSAGGPVTGPIPPGGIDAGDGTTNLPLTAAPALGTVKYIPNRSSVRLVLPAIDGARDYRVFAVEDGVTVSTVPDNREHVAGGTLHCAGLRQRNQCDDGEKLPIKYNNEVMDLPTCEIEGLDRRPNIPAELMQTLEVDGVGPDTTLVVEAIDRQCPFPGLFGSEHMDYAINGADISAPMADVVVNDKPYTIPIWQPTFPLRTEAEIRTEYGSMILNGQGPNMPTLDPGSPDFPESPWIRMGQPAPADDPVVLARSIVKVSPTGTATLPEGFTDQDYFDDFSDNTDQPKLLRDTDYLMDFIGCHTKVYTTNKWALYDVGTGFSNFFVDRGQLGMVFGDPYQGSMTLQAMYPKRPVQLPSEANQYLHVTYEVQRNETPRRYENLTLCGADTMGATYDGETPKSGPLPRPGFMNEGDTARSSPYGWNCLYLIPRGAGYGVLPGGDIASHADTSFAITVVATHPAPTGPEYDSQRITEFATEYGPSHETISKHWERQIDASGNISGVWLDDQTNAWQRARFDVYIRRDRVVIYVEGEQRLCQNLKANSLTMAEGALGFWHILYHTSAEFLEIRRGLQGDNPSTDQHHIIHNTPFADERSYDNVGFRENVAAPDDFDVDRCYTND